MNICHNDIGFYIDVHYIHSILVIKTDQRMQQKFAPFDTGRTFVIMKLLQLVLTSKYYKTFHHEEKQYMVMPLIDY